MAAEGGLCFKKPCYLVSQLVSQLVSYLVSKTRYERLSFLCGEGPRSRCYSRTAALRLLVQLCDEDAEKDDQFCSFSLVMEHW